MYLVYLSLVFSSSVSPTGNHPLASEFLYIFDISLDTLQKLVYAVYGLTTDEEYQHWKRVWLQSRKDSSMSTWWCAAGQKVVAAANE